MRDKKLSELEHSIGYNFKNKDLLFESLVHSSYANENKNIKFNERLEFLGDSVLSVVISSYLFSNLKECNEGTLSKIRATIVCEKSLRESSDNFALNKYIYMGKGEEKSGGRNKDSIISDAFEALIGAIYLDSGIYEVEKFIFKFMHSTIEMAISGKLFKDYKTQIQEILQNKKITNIKYSIIDEKGPDHSKIFTAALYINDFQVSIGKGKSKKEAEQCAAREAIIIEKNK